MFKVSPSINADTIANSLKINMQKSFRCPCYCPCSYNNKTDIIYINSQGYAEPFDYKKEQGKEHQQSAKRIELLLKHRLKHFVHTEEISIYLDRIQKDSIDFDVFYDTNTQLTKTHIDAINKALKDLAVELAAIRTPLTTKINI